ncbi:hypothetical protein C8R47DRAFT_797038 [Mycena vitilis]|nr:hypothetical protein C8R47DRAFT_797038 [Mycena vitilis]
MGFWTVVGCVAALLVLDLVLGRDDPDENGSNQDEARHDYYQPTPPPNSQRPPTHGTARNAELQRQAPPHLAPQHHYQATYGTIRNAEPARQPLATQPTGALRRQLIVPASTYEPIRNAEPARQHLAPQPPDTRPQLTPPASNVTVRSSSQPGDQLPRKTWASLAAENRRKWESTSETRRDAEPESQHAAPQLPNSGRQLTAPASNLTERFGGQTGDQPPRTPVRVCELKNSPNNSLPVQNWLAAENSRLWQSTSGTSHDVKPANLQKRITLLRELATPASNVTVQSSSQPSDQASRKSRALLFAERSNRKPESARQPSAPQQNILEPLSPDVLHGSAADNSHHYAGSARPPKQNPCKPQFLAPTTPASSGNIKPQSQTVDPPVPWRAKRAAEREALNVEVLMFAPQLSSQPSLTTPVPLSPSSDVATPSPTCDQTGDQSCPWVALRERASGARNLMREARAQSKFLRAVGRDDEAQKRDEERRAHARNMGRRNKEASEMIFLENNKIDLHGLFVPEANPKVKEAIAAADERGDAFIWFIVGQGHHSNNGVAILKPRVRAFIHRNADPRNEGVLVVSLTANITDQEVPTKTRRQPRTERASRRVSVY